MAFVKVSTRNGAVSQFIDENHDTQIERLVVDHKGQVELDEKGGVKRYTADEISSVARTSKKKSVEEILGIQPAKGKGAPKE